MRKLILLILFIGVTVNSFASEGILPAQYYLKHIDEAKAKIIDCENNKQTVTGAENCKNAQAAYNALTNKKQVAPIEDINSVQYYEKHLTEAKSKIINCENYPQSINGNKNCQNAQIALDKNNKSYSNQKTTIIDKNENLKSKHYYKSHISEAKQKLIDCANNPQSMNGEKNCENAEAVIAQKKAKEKADAVAAGFSNVRM